MKYVVEEGIERIGRHRGREEEEEGGGRREGGRR